MGIKRVSKVAILKSGRLDATQLQVGAAGARTAPGHAYVMGHTRGGARIEAIVSRFDGPVRFQVSGYASDGSDMALEVLP